MDRARRGYVLIAVMAGLALCVALAGAFAATSRRSLMLARADVEAVQARYAARGAAIQAAKDLSVGLGLGRIALDMRSGDQGAPPPSAASTTIEGLPAFPPEMAGAAGFLGILNRRMEQIRANEANGGRPPTGGGTSEEPTDDALVVDEVTGPEPGFVAAPVVVTGLGRMEFAGAVVDVVLESENGKINLNMATRRTLRDLFVLVGHDPDVAEMMLDAIELHRLSLLPSGSVERVAAARRDPERALRGGAIRRLEDLLNVPGMTVAMYESLASHLTIVGDGLVDPNYASFEVFQALGIRSNSLLMRLVEARREQEPITATRMREIVGPSVYAEVADRFAYTLPPLFTVRTRAVKGESIGRFMMRVTLDENGVPVLLESREGWM